MLFDEPDERAHPVDDVLIDPSCVSVLRYAEAMMTNWMRFAGTWNLTPIGWYVDWYSDGDDGHSRWKEEDIADVACSIAIVARTNAQIGITMYALLFHRRHPYVVELVPCYPKLHHVMLALQDAVAGPPP